jgi:hypothetical protein
MVIGMAASATTGSQGHPAPYRERVSLVTLLFGVWGGPIAWTVQLCVNSALASHTCFPSAVPLHAPQSGWNWPLQLAVNIASIGVALAAAWVSYGSWQATREEHAGRAHHALDVGEGRTRFFAICGMMTGLGFAATLIADTIVLFVVPLCLG